MKKLFVLFLAVTMTLQLFLPAWAEDMEASAAGAIETAIEEVNDAPEEKATEAPTEEASQAPTEEVTEVPTEGETEAPSEEVNAAPGEDKLESETKAVPVTFVCTVKEVVLVVFPAGKDTNNAISPKEDGIYLLLPGEYTYLAAAEGYETTQGSFTVLEGKEAVTVTVTLSEMAAEGAKPTETPKESNPTEEADISQSQFLEEYVSTETYTLEKSLTLTSDLTLNHDIIVASGGELLVSESVTLTLSGELTIDGGTVDVLAGGRLVLESAGRIDVQRGLLRVREYADFVNNAGSDAISAAQDSGIIQGIDLTEAEPTEATEPIGETEPTEETESTEVTEPTGEDEETSELTQEELSVVAYTPVLLGTPGNGIQAKIDLIRSMYDTGSYFTKSGTAHPINDPSVCPYDPNGKGMPYPTCECSLSQITRTPSGLLNGAEIRQLIGGDRWQCYAFATYVFYNIFGLDYKNPGCRTVPLSEAKLGDFVEFTFPTYPHYGIFLYATPSSIVVYNANSDAGSTCMVEYERHQKGYSSVTFYRAPNYDEVNGTTSHTLDLNGFLDGQSTENIFGYGTADIYVHYPDGTSTHTPNAYDFYEELPIGTTYEIKNIQAAAGHKFERVYSGSLSGTIGSDDVSVVLAFSTLPSCKVTYKNSSGDVSLTVSQGEYTVAGDYDKKDNSYFIGWAYTPNAEMFDVRPGEKINVTGDVTLYPVYISHEDAISGKPVLIYNISDFPADGYTVTETTKDISASATESGWSDWTGWSTTAVSETDTVQVESRTAYGWYYYQCPSCGAHMHGYGTCYTWAGGCGAAIPDDGGHPTYLPTSWDAAQDWYGTGKYYATIDGARWFRWNDGGTQTQYRSRQQVTNTTTVTKTYPAYVILPETVETITVSYNANGGTGAPGAQVFSVVPDGWTPKQIPGQEVLETKTQYSSRKKTVQSSAEKNLAGWTLISSEISGYGEWSAWTATPITADEDTEVQAKEVPATYKTVWHYSRDTANGYSTYAIGYYGNPEYITLDYPLTAKGTIDGHTHYGSYGSTLVNYWWNEESESVIDQNAYTAYSSRPIYHKYQYFKWSDWTEYSDTPVIASDTVEVQTRTMYRYATGVKISNTVPVRNGYTFLGWAVSSTATAATYQPGELFIPSTDTTLYAVWGSATLAIRTQPTDYVGALNSNATFSVAVNMENVTYKWYFSNDGEKWAASSATGCNTDTLTIVFAAHRMGQLYRCEITDEEGNTVISKAVTMKLPASTIHITSQPVNYYGAVADTASFTVMATGDSLTYRWYFSNNSGESWAASYSTGYQTATLSPVLRAYNSGRMFRCLITDANGNTEWTEPATMALKSSQITVQKQPVSYVGAIGDLAQFEVNASGENLTYQWYFSADNGATWQMSYNEGFNSPLLYVRLYAYRSGYQYKCIILSGNNIQAESNVVTIKKKPSTAAIISHPLNAGGVSGTDVTFHVEATGSGLKYRWQFSTDGGTTWGTTSMAGADTDTITVMVKPYRDGWQYRCLVMDDSGTSITSKAATLRMGDAPTITLQPVSVNTAAGTTANFTVAVTGEKLTYQWQYRTSDTANWANSGAATAKTATIEVVAYAYRNGQQYRCIISNEYGSVISNSAVLTIR